MDTLEKAASEGARQTLPTAGIADEEGNVSKIFSRDCVFVPALAGLTTDDFPVTTKVYLFDPDFVDEASTVAPPTKRVESVGSSNVSRALNISSSSLGQASP